jgi:hypothetical protein
VDRPGRPHRKLTKLVLDMDSSVSATYGRQQGSSDNGHFGRTCSHPPFVFKPCGDPERVMLRRRSHHGPKFRRRMLVSIIARDRGLEVPRSSEVDAAFASPKLSRPLESIGDDSSLGRVE